MNPKFITDLSKTLAALDGKTYAEKQSDGEGVWVVSPTWELMQAASETCVKVYGLEAVDLSVRKDVHYSVLFVFGG